MFISHIIFDTSHEHKEYATARNLSANYLKSGKNMHFNFTINPVFLLKSIIE